MGENLEHWGCHVCDGYSFTVVLDMGSQPLAERDDGGRYPLRLVRCGKCQLVQLADYVPQSEVFPLDHPYATGNTKALRNHFAELAQELQGFAAADDLVVDIGANDGTLLSNFVDVRRVGVEPTNQAAKCRDKGISVYQNFFSNKLAQMIRSVNGRAAIITATNVLAHVPNPHDFVQGVVNLLDDDGVFVTENHNLSSILIGMQLDTIYHEHLRYFSVATLSTLLEDHNLSVYKVREIPTHGGSFRAYARKTPVNFSDRANKVKEQLYDLLYGIAKEGHRIYGIGATTRATPLIHFTGIKDFITCVCEVSGSQKIGTNIPGTSIPIIDEASLITDHPTYALLLSWHIADDLMIKLREKGFKGDFIIPLPSPRIISYFNPILPVSVDKPSHERPEPRRWQYPLSSIIPRGEVNG